MTVQCSWCRSVKEGNRWNRRKTHLYGTHGICPACRAKIMGAYMKAGLDQGKPAHAK